MRLIHTASLNPRRNARNIQPRKMIAGRDDGGDQADGTAAACPSVPRGPVDGGYSAAFEELEHGGVAVVGMADGEAAAGDGEAGPADWGGGGYGVDGWCVGVCGRGGRDWGLLWELEGEGSIVEVGLFGCGFTSPDFNV